MAEFQRVPIRPRPARDWLSNVGLAFATFVTLAILKPWEWSQPAAAEAESAAPTFFVGPTQPSGPRGYDPRLFGGREPDPAWELWPAGYVVQFGLAGPVRVHGQDGASGAPGGPPATPARSADPVDSVAPGDSPAATEAPLVSGLVDLGTADHLVALGINTPLDVRVASVELFKVTGSRSDIIDLVHLPTLWESSHFMVIAPADPLDPGQPAAWEPALYRLRLTTAFGEVRLVDLRVREPAGASN